MVGGRFRTFPVVSNLEREITYHFMFAVSPRNGSALWLGCHQGESRLTQVVQMVAQLGGTIPLRREQSLL